MSTSFSERIENLNTKVRTHFEDYDIDKRKITHMLSLSLILFTAFFIRIASVLKGWDPLIKANDPQFQVRAAEYMQEHGFIQFLLWFDNVSWGPYGRQVGTSLYIAVPLAILLVYGISNLLGFDIPVEEAAFYVPAIFGTLGVIFTYLLCKELISTRAGLFGALIMAVTPAYLQRSTAGFVDNESLGVLFTVMAMYFFIRAYSRDSNKSGVLAGISMFLLGSSWGAFRFAFDLLPIYALLIVLTGNYSARFLKAYSTTVGISTILMIFIPRIGGDFLFDFEGIIPVAMIGFLILVGIIQDLSKSLTPSAYRRVIFYGLSSLILIFVGLLLVLVNLGGVNFIGDKFISVLLPNSRNSLPLVDSVAEHQPLAWGSLFSNLTTLLFFIPLGVYFAIKKPNEKNLFILTFGLISLIFSGLMIRLLLLLAPSAALLGAFAIDGLLKPYAYAGHKRIGLSKKTMSLSSIGTREAGTTYVITFILLAIMVIPSITTAVDNYGNPDQIIPIDSQQSINGALTDWVDAFEWMKKHTSYYNYTKSNDYQGFDNNLKLPLMMSWWDYGYYITAKGDTATLVDNATTNSTQIGVVGAMLMLNMSFSLPLMHQYGVDYVLVYAAGGHSGLGSDISKSIWPIRISEQYAPQYGITESEYYDSNTGTFVDKYYDSLLYQLIAYRSPDMDTSQAEEQLPPFYNNNPSIPEQRNNVVTELPYFTEAFRSTGLAKELPGNYPLIRIYKINYPADINLRVNEFNEFVDQNLIDLEN